MKLGRRSNFSKMKKALNSILLIVCSIFLTFIWEPFSLYATGDSFDSVNYQLVDYITPNGNSVAINTGYKVNKDTNIIAVMYSSFDSGNYYLGSGGSTNQFGIAAVSSNRYRVRNANGTNAYYSSNNSFVDEITTINYTPSQTVFSFTNSPSITVSQTASNNTATTYMGIFANYSGSSFSNYLKNGRLYDLQIYENSVLVHHYYPCYRKSDNVVGIFDGVSNVFITSSGGNLAYGSAVLQQYTITTAVSPSGSGTVTGGGTYNSGSTANLTATAYSGYVFSSWSDGNTSNPRSVTVSSDTTYTAVFEQESTPTPSYTLSLSVSPTGSGTVSGAGSYTSGTSVSISATAGSGYEFVKWSDDVTANPRTIVISANTSLTAIFDVESVEPDPTPPSSWTDWTDEDDQEYLEAAQVDFSKLYWSTNFQRVIDFIQIYSDQFQVNESFNGDTHVSILGTYYDNTITGLTGCNSSSYNYTTSSSSTTNVVTIQPAIYGSFDSNIGNEEGIIFDFGISLNGGSTTQVTTSANGFSNTTEACRLIGMNDGDSSIDGTTLLAAGYTKKTVTYNDGSNNGHTATFYVPGDEEIDLSMDMSFLEDLLDALVINVVNQTRIYQHDEFILRFHGKDGYLLPEYGHIHSDAFIGTLFSHLDLNSSNPFTYKTGQKFYSVYQEDTYVSFNPIFSYHSTNNIYDRNYVDLYWQNTRNPIWVFKTDPVQGSTIGSGSNETLRPYYYYSNDYGGYISSTAEAYTVQSSDVLLNSSLEVGKVMYVGLKSVDLYNYKNNSILNRFNQLGSFLNSWFNRIYQSIGNITGGNESNEIINNVVNDYDISVETDFNGLLQNVQNKREDIDLTLPEFNIPSSDLNGVQSLAQPLSDVFDIYIDNGLGIMVFIPVLLLVLRLIL